MYTLRQWEETARTLITIRVPWLSKHSTWRHRVWGLTERVSTPPEENCPVAELTQQELWRKQYFVNELYSSTIKSMVPLSLRTLIALLLVTGVLQIVSLKWLMRDALSETEGCVIQCWRVRSNTEMMKKLRLKEKITFFSRNTSFEDHWMRIKKSLTDLRRLIDSSYFQIWTSRATTGQWCSLHDMVKSLTYRHES